MLSLQINVNRARSLARTELGHHQIRIFVASIDCSLFSHFVNFGDAVNHKKHSSVENNNAFCTRERIDDHGEVVGVADWSTRAYKAYFSAEVGRAITQTH
jgi:hypothetical protein